MSLLMHTVSYSTGKESQLLSMFCKVARDTFTTLSLRTVNVHVLSALPKRLLSGLEMRWLLGNKRGTVKPTAESN